jgi:hypothetical protein
MTTAAATTNITLIIIIIVIQFIIYVPSQQLQGQLWTQQIVDIDIYSKINKSMCVD